MATRRTRLVWCSSSFTVPAVCVCVRERARESVCACVCVRERESAREKERAREREGTKEGGSHGWSGAPAPSPCLPFTFGVQGVACTLGSGAGRPLGRSGETEGPTAAFGRDGSPRRHPVCMPNPKSRGGRGCSGAPAHSPCLVFRVRG